MRIIRRQSVETKSGLCPPWSQLCKLCIIKVKVLPPPPAFVLTNSFDFTGSSWVLLSCLLLHRSITGKSSAAGYSTSFNGMRQWIQGESQRVAERKNERRITKKRRTRGKVQRQREKISFPATREKFFTQPRCFSPKHTNENLLRCAWHGRKNVSLLGCFGFFCRHTIFLSHSLSGMLV